MKIAGIITEYNPFHNGHAYQLAQIKKITDCDCICVVMSGNYCQRGIPAVTDKYQRAYTALCGGVDLVLELPVSSVLSSAQDFAEAGVRILANAGISYLCFGAECDNLTKLKDIADFLSDIKPSLFKEQMAEGISYARSIANIVKKELGCEYADELSRPNNILAVEYLKALKNFPGITPILIKRQGDNYTDIKVSNKNMASATAIRELIKDNNISSLSETLPPYSLSRLQNPIFIDDFTNCHNSIMHSLIWQGFDFTQIDGIDESLANKIKNKFTGTTSLSEFAMSLKTKNLTYSNICRSLLKIILGIKSHDKNLYLRVLGFNENGAKIIKNAKKNLNLPIITKTADYKELFNCEAHCTDIYNSVVFEKYNTINKNEYERQLKKWQ